jgi:hypothetical protein
MRQEVTSEQAVYHTDFPRLPVLRGPAQSSQVPAQIKLQSLCIITALTGIR